jgi:radical SAM protein with 4Fe4S-binding SPASM domain
MKNLMMSIEFTNHCNHDCVMCPQSVYRQDNRFDRNKGWLSDDVFDLFLENARKYAKSVCIGFFGEQMLHPRFYEFMNRLAKDRPYELTLFSDWSLLEASMSPLLIGCDVVKISLDASNCELFNKLCPGGDYNTVVNNIEWWLDLPGHSKTYLVFVTSSLNKHDKQAFLDKWLPKLPKNDGIITKSVISYGGVMKDEYMTDNACKVADQNRLIVSWNGDCSPCNLDVNMSMKAGNIQETNDVADIIDGGIYKNWIKSIKRKEGICENCFDANNHKETVIHRRVA